MRHQHGGDIYTDHIRIDFSTNINPFGPSKGVLEAAAKSLASIGCYPDVMCRKLGKALAESIHVPEEQLIFGNGAADIIYSLVTAVKPGKALLLAPSFSEYEQALKAAGCRIEYYQLKEETGFALSGAYVEALTEELDMIFLCSPHNPTGRKIEKVLLEQILDRCRELGIRMVLDECFYEFLEEPDRCTMQENIKGAPQLFLLRAFTKMYAMPGLRLGYGISSDQELLEQIGLVRQPWSVSNVAQAAGIAALKEPDRAAMTRAYIKEERRWMEERLLELGVICYPSDANYMLVKGPRDLGEQLKRQGILIRDCQNYRGLEPGYYRIAVKRREENEELIKALGLLRMNRLTDGKEEKEWQDRS